MSVTAMGNVANHSLVTGRPTAVSPHAVGVFVVRMPTARQSTTGPSALALRTSSGNPSPGATRNAPGTAIAPPTKPASVSAALILALNPTPTYAARERLVRQPITRQSAHVLVVTLEIPSSAVESSKRKIFATPTLVVRVPTARPGSTDQELTGLCAPVLPATGEIP